MSVQSVAVKIGQDKFPLTITFPEGSTPELFSEWFNDNRDWIESKLLEVGAIFIEHIGVDAVDKFQSLMEKIAPDSPAFRDGNSPRGKYSANVYNASEYDANADIRLHTEYSYSNLWPGKLYFCCSIRAATGGETTVGDTKKMLSRLSPALVEEFDRKGIRYIRNMHGGTGLGPSWQEAFETDSRQFLEEYCRNNETEVQWQKDGTARFIQLRPAIRVHPVTGDRLWFNQVDQYFPQIYGEEIYDTLVMMAGNDPEALPMCATYGDGSPIQKEYIEEIIRILDEETIPVPWKKGDLLIVENMIALHGRLAYTGDRKILVSMTK